MRNDEGIVLARKARRLLNGTNNEVEVRAALLVVLLVDKLSIIKLHLEGDSKIVSEAIAKGVSQLWQINKIIFTIAQKFIKKICMFIEREILKQIDFQI